MKQLKPLKMFVPESAEIREHNSYYGSDIDAGITRQEIHKLIQEKAVELGWNEVGEFVKWSFINSKFIFLHSDGVIKFDFFDYEYFNNSEFQEITWKDFLKFTQGDVEVNSSEISNSSTPTDRNEKAWEILKVIIQTYPNSNDQTSVDMAFKITDEFLKQAGNK